MKLPEQKNIADIILDSCFEDRYRCLHIADAERAGDRIIGLIKQVQFDDDKSSEIDPKIITIAELEAKIKVYEAVIEGAGIKLNIKTEKKKNET